MRRLTRTISLLSAYLAQMLAATLMHPSIPVAVVGIKTAEQIEEAAGAMGQSLERSDYYAVRGALEAGGAAKIKDASGKTR